jgi:hypothetical protein
MDDAALAVHMLEQDASLGVNGNSLKGIAQAIRSDHGFNSSNDREVVEEAHRNAHANGQGGEHSHQEGI